LEICSQIAEVWKLLMKRASSIAPETGEYQDHARGKGQDTGLRPAKALSDEMQSVDSSHSLLSLLR